MRRAWDTHQLVWALAVLVLVAGCARVSPASDEAADIEISLDLDPSPPLFGRPCELRVAVFDAAGTGVEGAELEIKGDMTHAGMVPVVVTISEGEAGIYVTDLAWTMAGDWILTVQARLPDGRVARRQFEVRVEIPGG